MDDPASARLPCWVVIFLAICLCSLAVHFYAESLGADGLPFALMLAESAGHFDDHFVSPARLSVQLNGLWIVLVPDATLSLGAVGLLPLIPPPNS
jgi:hypothetical protein